MERLQAFTSDNTPPAEKNNLTFAVHETSLAATSTSFAQKTSQQKLPAKSLHERTSPNSISMESIRGLFFRFSIEILLRWFRK